MHASTLQHHLEPLWAHSLSSIASPCSSWIGGGTFWGARSGTTNQGITLNQHTKEELHLGQPPQCQQYGGIALNHNLK
jgi:hypothetical protein